MTEKSLPPDCFDEYDPNSMLVEQALTIIEQTINPVTGTESLFVGSALGRILAQPVVSNMNVPAYTNSGMDGYAIVGSDIRAGKELTLDVIGTVHAGHSFDKAVNSGQCVRIMTGAPIPQGADTVVMQEHTERTKDRVTIKGSHRSGQNVRRAGEDIAIGTSVLPIGRTLIPADIGLIASLGISEVSVYRKIRVAFFSTGDEICSLGQTPRDNQIYDSNRYTLLGMLQRMNVDTLDMGIVADDKNALRTAFSNAAQNADVVITSGGVSVGEADFIKEILGEQGKINFWKIAMKPGRPLAYGTIGKSLFFGLPGNPVSAMVTFYQYLQPALKRLSGETSTRALSLRLTCVTALKKAPGRIEYQRGILFQNEQGETVVRSTGPQGSHVLSSMSMANCFIVLPMDCGNLEPNTVVEVQPFAGMV